MYRIRILFSGVLFCLLAFNAFAENPQANTKAHVSGSGGGSGDGSGGGRAQQRKEFVNTLTYEERLANRGKGSGGLGLGRLGKPPKGTKKGGGELISIIAPEETRKLFEMLTLFYKKKHNVNFQIEYSSALDAASLIEDKNNIDLLITDDSDLIKKLELASRLKSKLEHFRHRVVFVASNKSKALKNLKGICSGEYSNLAVVQESGTMLTDLLELALRKSGVWDRCKDKIITISDLNQLEAQLKSKQVDIAFTYYSAVKNNKNIELVYELKKSEYPVPELPIALLSAQVSAQKGKSREEVLDFFKFLDSHFADKFFKTFGYASSWKN